MKYSHFVEDLNIKTDNLVSKKVKWSVFLFSVTIHLIVAFLFINIPIALDDMFQYDMLGRSLSSGNGYRWYAKADVEILKPYLESFMDIDHMVFPENGIETAFRAPGYPLFLSLLYLINSTQTRFVLVRIVQAILMALLAPMVIKLGEVIGLSRKQNILSGVLISLYPILLFYPIGLASEDIFIPLFLFALLLAFLTARENKVLLYIVFGIILGFLILTRSVAVVFAGVSLVWLSFFSRLKFKGALVTGLLIVAICLPWVVRNSQIMKKPAFVENSFWYNMYIGYHPKGTGGFVSDIAIIPLFMTDDSERDQYCRNYALTFIESDPMEALKRVITRVPDFFGPETRELNYFYSNNILGYIPPPWLEFVYLLLTLPWFMTCFFGVIGFWYSPNRVLSCLTGVLLSFYVIPHFFILAEPRFHLALVPVLIPFAVIGFEKVFSSSKIQQTRRLFKPGIMLFLLLGLVIIWTFKINLDWPTVFRLLMPNGNLVGLSY